MVAVGARPPTRAELAAGGARRSADSHAGSVGSRLSSGQPCCRPRRGDLDVAANPGPRLAVLEEYPANGLRGRRRRCGNFARRKPGSVRLGWGAPGQPGIYVKQIGDDAAPLRITRGEPWSDRLVGRLTANGGFPPRPTRGVDLIVSSSLGGDEGSYEPVIFAITVHIQQHPVVTQR